MSNAICALNNVSTFNIFGKCPELIGQSKELIGALYFLIDYGRAINNAATASSK
jgi:hypothetical protein